jgi:hypothetical protein
VVALLQGAKETLSSSEVNAHIAFLPTYATATWHFGTEEYWVHDFNSDRLTVLRLVLPFYKSETADTGLVAELAQILQAAILEAASWGLKQIAVWNPEEIVLSTTESRLGIKPIVREEIESYIPCLRWKGDDSRSDIKKWIDWSLRDAYQRC